MITVPVCRKFIGTLSYGNICLNRVGKRFTYAFHRTNICAGAVNDALGEHSKLYGDVMPAQNCQSALAEHARVHLAHAHMRIQERGSLPDDLIRGDAAAKILAAFDQIQKRADAARSARKQLFALGDRAGEAFLLHHFPQRLQIVYDTHLRFV